MKKSYKRILNFSTKFLCFFKRKNYTSIGQFMKFVKKNVNVQNIAAGVLQRNDVYMTMHNNGLNGCYIV